MRRLNMSTASLEVCLKLVTHAYCSDYHRIIIHANGLEDGDPHIQSQNDDRTGKGCEKASDTQYSLTITIQGDLVEIEGRLSW
jgi:hypothetical protein